MDGMKRFGDLIRRKREERGFRGEDLAAKIGRAPSWVSRLELGGSANPPDTHMFRLLAGELGLSPTEMLEALGYLDPPDEHAIKEEHAAYGADVPPEVVTALREISWDVETANDVASVLRVIAKRRSAFTPRIDPSKYDRKP